MPINTPAITLNNASLRLGNRTLWKKMNLAIKPGEFIAVLGPNGAGKSSLLKTILGLQQLQQGAVEVLGTNPQHARGSIGYIPQQKAFGPGTALTGRELVKLGVQGTQWWLRPTTAEQSAQVTAALAETGTKKFADKPLGQLSGGEQQRLRIAQALVANPRVMLCDEPLLSLDMPSQQAIAALIKAQCQKGTAVLFVTHEINPALPLVDRVLYIVGGKWAIGTPQEILTTKTLTELYGAPVEVLRVHGRIIVISAGEAVATEPYDPHHHLAHGEAHA